MRDLSLLKVDGGNHFDEWTFCIQRKAESDFEENTNQQR